MTEFVHSACGKFFLPKEPPKPPERKQYAPVEPLVDEPFGENPDGSLTLRPEVVRVLRKLMLNRGSQIKPPDREDMQTLADAIWLHQRIGFEQYT